MSRKALSLAAGILGAVLGAYGARLGFEWLHREPEISPEVVTRAWVEQAVGPAGVTFETPWPLESQKMEWPPELAQIVAVSNMLSHEADGLNITTMYVEFVPGTPLDLDGAADGAFESLKSVPGTVSVDGSKRESTILHRRAVQFEADVERKGRRPAHVRGVVFQDRLGMYQILMIGRSDQELGARAWERLVQSVRRIEI